MCIKRILLSRTLSIECAGSECRPVRAIHSLVPLSRPPPVVVSGKTAIMSSHIRQHRRFGVIEPKPKLLLASWQP